MTTDEAASTTTDAVLDAPLRDVDGDAATMRDHLGPGPLVAVFLRHFG